MLEVKGLAHTYTNTRKIQFPDFQVGNNQHCLLLGKSGSGKTTLLHLIGGLLTAQVGTIKINSTSLSDKKGAEIDKFRGRNIGFVFQKPHLLKSLTVLDNLLLAAKLAGKPADIEKAKSVLLELDIENISKKKPAQLSQGQQQRVAVARALVNDPILILADEPTASLDDENAQLVIELLTNQAEKHNASLVVATHDERVKKQFQNCIEL